MSRWHKGDPIRTGGTFWRPRYRFRTGAAYEIGHGGMVATVEPDFTFDVSAPLLALPLLHILGAYRKMVRASGLHDYARRDPAWSLWFGDLIFCDALHTDGVREPLLTLCWWAVRSNNNRT